ncbi:unnamed protein product [Lymnaea stagnalis]|uniref:Uncharacterized protein n=1 Tax=Lymnaea stagnalis TaxID=6523 RepID=A0AAV2HNE2_LYMST
MTSPTEANGLLYSVASSLVVSTMTSSSPAASLLTTHPNSVSTESALTTTTSSAPTRDLDLKIQEFWSSFPCPPPWRPRLLIEVNSTRLDPQVSRTVQSFLAGKCEIGHILFPSDYNLDAGNSKHKLNPVPRFTDGADHGSSSHGDLSTADHHWCDTPCQLSIGCAMFFVVVVMMVAVLVCITKHRVRHKMAATRPSRQQLQLSTSTSDAVNCTDFSNLEVQADDDVIYPPFRHRGLPNPPMACHPVCDPKWNCPSCTSRHPLMRMSPSSHCYSRAYSAVYETIDDDDDDDVPRTEDSSQSRSRGRTPTNSNSRESCHSCSPCQTSPTSISTVQIRPRRYDDVRGGGGHQVAETGFNGEENLEQFPVTFLPNYFELEHNCALSQNPSGETIADASFLNTSTQRDASSECHANGAFTRCDQGHGFSCPQQYPHIAGTPLHSYLMSQIHQNAIPSAGDLYRVRPTTTAASRDGESCRADDLRTSANLSHSTTSKFEGPGFGSTFVPQPQLCHNSSAINHSLNPTRAGRQQQQPHDHTTPRQGQHGGSTSSFESPGRYFCSTCKPDYIPGLKGSGRDNAPRQRTPSSGGPNCVIIGPDLLKEASNQMIQELAGPAARTDTADDKNEVPLRKPVLALHSQYFAKTSAA